MSTPAFTLSLVRELRGSPLTILVACILLEQSGQVPITAQLLKDVTGYRDHTITDSLRALESPTRQLVARVTGGWRLACAFQLPLELSTGEVDNSNQNRDIRGFGVSSSSSSSRRPVSFLLEEEEEGENRDIRGFGENHSLLVSLGVGEPKATQLANLHHVTPEFILSHFNAIKGSTLGIGTAIYRIEHNWSVDHLPPAPPKPRKGDRYIEGEFAEYIQH
jgi:hypothetical protein